MESGLMAMTDQNTSLVGRSSATRSVNDDITRAARSHAKVLITGESGTGKEVTARLIHLRSDRRDRCLLTMNCAGIPDSLLESELFGHKRGSFTGALRDKPGLLKQSHGGTLLMDEIGEMTLRMQGLLLRFLETGEIQAVGAERIERCVDVRVIAATNRDLAESVSKTEFRLDLYYRLKVVHIHLLPLREHRDDIVDLVDHFLGVFAAQYRLPKRTLSPAALGILMEYDWPGNVRQLRNVVEQLMVNGRSGEIAADELPVEVGALPVAPEAPAMKAATIVERMLNGTESFWSAVYGPFMQRDLTRDDVRFIVRCGLAKTHGSYTGLVDAFNMAPDDYKRFLNFLRKHQCQTSFQPFRSATPDAHGRGREEESRLPAGRRFQPEAAHI
jgi:transcriptional regulator with PAS, ATPase and Fis domain